MKLKAICATSVMAFSLGQSPTPAKADDTKWYAVEFGPDYCVAAENMPWAKSGFSQGHTPFDFYQAMLAMKVTIRDASTTEPVIVLMNQQFPGRNVLYAVGPVVQGQQLWMQFVQGLELCRQVAALTPPNPAPLAH